MYAAYYDYNSSLRILLLKIWYFWNLLITRILEEYCKQFWHSPFTTCLSCKFDYIGFGVWIYHFQLCWNSWYIFFLGTKDDFLMRKRKKNLILMVAISNPEFKFSSILNHLISLCISLTLNQTCPSKHFLSSEDFLHNL
jgi:hypothetical protein